MARKCKGCSLLRTAWNLPRSAKLAPEIECSQFRGLQKIDQGGKTIPSGPKGLYCKNKGLFSEALVYHDDESIYFPSAGQGKRT